MNKNISTFFFFVFSLSFSALVHAQSELGENNLAPLGEASQSSTGWSGAASRAIDENTSGVYKDKSVTHTKFETEAWWELTLAAQSEVTNVVLYNRSDNCCTSRLQDVYVFLSDTPFENQTLAELLANENVESVFLSGEQGAEIDVPLSGVGSYVRVQLAGYGPLSLAEVAVYGEEVSIPMPEGINLAPLGVASQSSTGWSGAASRAIDENTAGVYRQKSVTHTLNELEPWWELNLAEQSEVTGVVLYNRTDNCCTSRLQDVYVFLSDTPFENQTLAEILANENIASVFLSGEQETETIVPLTGTGSYVRVQLGIKGPLSLAEVQVYGEEITPEPVAVPETPINMSPAIDASIEALTTQTFVWEEQAVATSYDFNLYNADTYELTATNDIDPALACVEGSCSLEVVVDLPVFENHAWKVQATNESGSSDWSESEFDVTYALTSVPDTLVLSLPEENAVFEPGATVVTQWQADPLATTYDFGLYDPATDTTAYDAAYAAIAICTDAACSVSKVLEFPEGDGYQVSVRANNRLGSSLWADRTFSVEVPVVDVPVTVAPDTPINLSPDVDVEIEEGATVTFSWSAVETADSYDFHTFEKGTGDLQFTSDMLSADVCTDDVCQLTTVVDLPEGTDHAWRVRATNVIGNSSWSRSIFDVIPVPDFTPAVPVNIAPAVDSVLIASSTQSFTWEPVTDAVTYDFHFFDASVGELPYILDLDAANVCSDTVCEYQTEIMSTIALGHAWRVRSVNLEGTSDWSRSSFITRDEDSVEPVAQFSLSTVFGTAPVEVFADATAAYDANAITDYRWDFGGESVVSGADAITASHVFLYAGTYSVALTVSNAAGFSDSYSIDVTVNEGIPVGAPTEAEAARLLAQASFGASTIAIQQVRQLGLEEWIDAQLELQGPAHLDYVSAYSNGSNRDARHEIWWLDAVDGEDQLRQRVAFALSQLMVISDTGYTLANAQYGVTNYYDILRNYAFGNFRDLLEEVTLNPIMGIYLSMLQNDKGSDASNTRADENFAREVMQLFTLGLYNLNQDGTLAGGDTYTQEDIESMSRVFTGWNYKDAGQWDRALFTGQDLLNPMEAFEDHHDTNAKVLFDGTIVPAGQSAQADLDMTLDSIFAHQNVGPFVSTHLIRQLVTSNPSTGYVSRVAGVFNDNGSGVKGDLGATVKAILMDDEARYSDGLTNFGKMREPVLRLSHLWRAFSITPGNLSSRGEYNTYSTQLKNIETITGQAVLRSSSVFNFFSPSYSSTGPVRTANLVSPEFEIFTDTNILSTASRVNDQIHRHYKQNSSSSELNPSYLDFEYEIELAEDPQSLLDHLDILLLSGAMSEELNALLLSHLMTLSENESGYKQRVQDAVSLIVASPEYLVQK